MNSLEVARAELAEARRQWEATGAAILRSQVPPVQRWRGLPMGAFFQQRADAFKRAMERVRRAQQAVNGLTSSCAPGVDSG